MEPQHSLCSVLTSCFVHISCMLITKMARKKAYCSIDNPRYRKVLDQVASSSTPLPPFCPLGGGRVQFVWKGTWPFKNLGEALSLFSMFPHTDTLRDELIHFRLLTEHWILAAFVYLCACSYFTSRTHMHSVNGSVCSVTSSLALLRKRHCATVHSWMSRWHLFV